MKLHLGCGGRRIPGYVNIDIRWVNGADVIADIKSLTGFQNNSAEVIYACHVLEHFKKAERMAVLRRWYNVLIPGGVLRLSVPDFEAVAINYLDKTIPLEALYTSISGSQKHDHDYHYHTYDFATLGEDLLTVGFSSIKRYDWRTTEHADVDDYSSAYYPHMDKENGILLSLNVEAVKP